MNALLARCRVPPALYDPDIDAVVLEIGGRLRVFRAGWSWWSLVSLGYRYDIFSGLGRILSVAWAVFVVVMTRNLVATHPWIGVPLVLGILGLLVHKGRSGEEAFIRKRISQGSWCVVCRGVSDAQALEAAELPEGGSSIGSDRDLFDPPAIAEPVDRPDVGDDEVGFGYKMAWMAIPPGASSVSLAGIFPGRPRAVSLGFAIEQVYHDEKNTALIQLASGWTLVVGFGLCELLAATGSGRFDSRLQALLARHGDLQWFATHRVAEVHGWARFEKGALVRFVMVADGQVQVDGTASDLEREMVREHGYGAGEDPEEESTGDDFEAVSEEVVVKLAAAWGVDPLAVRPSDTLLVSLWRA